MAATSHLAIYEEGGLVSLIEIWVKQDLSTITGKGKLKT